MGFRYETDSLRDPLFNDFNAFVNEVARREGAIPDMDSETRRRVAEAVTKAFGVSPSASDG